MDVTRARREDLMQQLLRRMLAQSACQAGE